VASDQKVALDLDQLTLADVDGALLDGLKIDFSVTARRPSVRGTPELRVDRPGISTLIWISFQSPPAPQATDSKNIYPNRKTERHGSESRRQLSETGRPLPTDVLLEFLGGKLVNEQAVQARWTISVAASPKGALDCVDTWGTDFRRGKPAQKVAGAPPVADPSAWRQAVATAASARDDSSDPTSILRDHHSITCSNRGFGLDSGTWYRGSGWTRSPGDRDDRERDSDGR
jgi:hypothetical protein